MRGCLPKGDKHKHKTLPKNKFQAPKQNKIAPEKKIGLINPIIRGLQPPQQTYWAKKPRKWKVMKKKRNKEIGRLAHLEVDPAADVILEALTDLIPIRVCQPSSSDNIIGQALAVGRCRPSDDRPAHHRGERAHIIATCDGIQHLPDPSSP